MPRESANAAEYDSRGMFRNPVQMGGVRLPSKTRDRSEPVRRVASHAFNFEDSPELQAQILAGLDESVDMRFEHLSGVGQEMVRQGMISQAEVRQGATDVNPTVLPTAIPVAQTDRAGAGSPGRGAEVAPEERYGFDQRPLARRRTIAAGFPEVPGFTQDTQAETYDLPEPGDKIYDPNDRSTPTVTNTDTDGETLTFDDGTALHFAEFGDWMTSGKTVIYRKAIRSVVDRGIANNPGNGNIAARTQRRLGVMVGDIVTWAPDAYAEATMGDYTPNVSDHGKVTDIRPDEGAATVAWDVLGGDPQGGAEVDVADYWLQKVSARQLAMLRQRAMSRRQAAVQPVQNEKARAKQAAMDLLMRAEAAAKRGDRATASALEARAEQMIHQLSANQAHHILGSRRTAYSVGDAFRFGDGSVGTVTDVRQSTFGDQMGTEVEVKFDDGGSMVLESAELDVDLQGGKVTRVSRRQAARPSDYDAAPTGAARLRPRS